MAGSMAASEHSATSLSSMHLLRKRKLVGPRDPTAGAVPKLTVQRTPERSRTPISAPLAGNDTQICSNLLITSPGWMGRVAAVPFDCAGSDFLSLVPAWDIPSPHGSANACILTKLPPAAEPVLGLGGCGSLVHPGDNRMMKNAAGRARQISCFASVMLAP